MGSKTLAPFPYFGGKQYLAATVWQHLGNVSNYIEPFAGSLGVYLQAPYQPKYVTLNDADALLVNAWRMLKYEPNETLLDFFDRPISEIDLQAWHLRLLVARADGGLSAALRSDPHCYDAELGAAWIWGANVFIGSRWGAKYQQAKPRTQADTATPKKAQLDYIRQRLASARILCGDWSRTVSSYSDTTRNGLTGVYLDPPYGESGIDVDYAVGGNQNSDILDGVLAWAFEHGDNPEMRIIISKYDATPNLPEGWVEISKKANKGYGSVDNAKRERMLISPHCNTQNTLFQEVEK